MLGGRSGGFMLSFELCYLFAWHDFDSVDTVRNIDCAVLSPCLKA